MGKSASLANIGSVADAPFTFRNRLINGNGDYRAYLAWLYEGNQPLPAEEQSTNPN